jgi:hypothetical protein
MIPVRVFFQSIPLDLADPSEPVGYLAQSVPREGVHTESNVSDEAMLQDSWERPFPRYTASAARPGREPERAQSSWPPTSAPDCRTRSRVSSCSGVAQARVKVGSLIVVP